MKIKLDAGIPPATTKKFQDYIGYSDIELINKILSGEVALFELIMRRYNRRLYRAARGILSQDNLAQDAVQEAYIKAYQHLAEFRGPAGFNAWLVQITIREALRIVRQENKLSCVSSASNNLEQTPDSNQLSIGQASQSPEAQLSSAEITRLTSEMLSHIPRDFRLVFMLREVEGLSVAETAAILEIEPNTVKSRLFRAKASLRAQFSRRLDDYAQQLFPFAGQQCDAIVEHVMSKIMQ